MANAAAVADRRRRFVDLVLSDEDIRNDLANQLAELKEDRPSVAVTDAEIARLRSGANTAAAEVTRTLVLIVTGTLLTLR